MGLNVRCAICGKLVRHVETDKLHTIVGDEVCEDCQTKVRKIWDDFQKTKTKFFTKLEELTNETVKEIKRMRREVQDKQDEFITVFKALDNQIQKCRQRYYGDFDGLFNASYRELNEKIMKLGKYFKEK